MIVFRLSSKPMWAPLVQIQPQLKELQREWRCRLDSEWLLNALKQNHREKSQRPKEIWRDFSSCCSCSDPCQALRAGVRAIHLHSVLEGEGAGGFALQKSRNVNDDRRESNPSAGVSTDQFSFRGAASPNTEALIREQNISVVQGSVIAPRVSLSECSMGLQPCQVEHTKSREQDKTLMPEEPGNPRDRGCGAALKSLCSDWEKMTTFCSKHDMKPLLLHVLQCRSALSQWQGLWVLAAFALWALVLHIQLSQMETVVYFTADNLRSALDPLSLKQSVFFVSLLITSTSSPWSAFLPWACYWLFLWPANS